MATSTATSVEEYLAELPPERREVVSKVRELVRRNLPKGYNETMTGGMIGYGVPLSRYPNTYNGQPLGYVALLAAVKSGQVRTAGLDSFAVEPMVAGHPFQGQKGFVLSPHIGGVTGDAYVKMGVAAARNALDVLAKQQAPA